MKKLTPIQNILSFILFYLSVFKIIKPNVSHLSEIK